MDKRPAFTAFFLFLFLLLHVIAGAQDTAWRVLIMGDLSKPEAAARMEEFRPMGDVVVLPYNGKFGVFAGSFTTQEDAQAKLQDYRAEGWLVADTVQPGMTGAAPVTPAPTADFGATPPPEPTVVFSNASNSETSGDSSYRVEAGTFSDMAAAAARKEDLENNYGVVPADIAKENGEIRVYVGYPATSRVAADQFADTLRRDIPQISFTVVASKAAPAVTTQMDGIANTASQDEINYVKKLQSQIEQGREGRIDQAEAQRAADAVKNLDAKQREMLDQFAIQKQREADANRFTQEIRRAANNGEMAKADGMLQQWRGSDPTNIALPLMQDWLESKKRSLQPANTSGQTLIADAEQAEKSGDLQRALDLWMNVRKTAVDDATTRRAVDRIDDLTSRLSKTERAAPPASAASSGISTRTLLYIGIGVGVILIVLIVVFLMTRKKSAATPLAPARGMTMTTASPTGGNSMLASMQGVKRDSKSAPRFSSSTSVQRLPSRDRPSNPRPSGEVSRPSSGEGQRRESHHSPVPSAPPQHREESDSIAPPAGSLEGSSSDSQRGGSINSSSVHLDNLMMPHSDSDEDSFDPTAETLVQHPSSSATVRQPSGDSDAAHDAPSSRPATPLHTPPLVRGSADTVLTPVASQALAARSPVPVATPGSIYFEQDFNNEEIGTSPKAWKGSYDYASLSIVEREGGSGRCMKFEKKKGTGSAYYSCRFPDAGGRVVVEFDLRCDHKNKYLLGFYVEMDEDFRHSVHTVVHMDATKADKVSLRLQNETAPYKLGEWSRIRYLIDLPRNMVDGFVDDKPVAVGVRLPSRPRVVNTLSIRDNLATEGILLIDNIKIFKDRA